MSKHTPGSWMVWPDNNGRLQVGASTNYSVAEMCFTPLEGQEANARLIAAAPDLLEACQTFAKWLRREEDGFDHKTHNSETPEGEAAWREWFYGNVALCCLAQEQARAAIAKATGEKK